MRAIFKKHTLGCLDPLYRDIIKSRSLIERLEYCRSLYYRTEIDMQCEGEKMSKSKRKLLLKVVKTEIKKLQNMLKNMQQG